jgi:hypothetical protein
LPACAAASWRASRPSAIHDRGEARLGGSHPVLPTSPREFTVPASSDLEQPRLSSLSPLGRGRSRPRSPAPRPGTRLPQRPRSPPPEPSSAAAKPALASQPASNPAESIRIVTRLARKPDKSASPTATRSPRPRASVLARTVTQTPDQGKSGSCLAVSGRSKKVGSCLASPRALAQSPQPVASKTAVPGSFPRLICCIYSFNVQEKPYHPHRARGARSAIGRGSGGERSRNLMGS